jgi:hypothetical protein
MISLGSRKPQLPDHTPRSCPEDGGHRNFLETAGAIRLGLARADDPGRRAVRGDPGGKRAYHRVPAPTTQLSPISTTGISAAPMPIWDPDADCHGDRLQASS